MATLLAAAAAAAASLRLTRAAAFDHFILPITYYFLIVLFRFFITVGL